MNQEQGENRTEQIKEELRELRHKLSSCSTNSELEFRITELEDELEDLKRKQDGA